MYSMARTMLSPSLDGRVRRDDIPVLQFGGRLDLTEEPVAHAGPLDQLPADDLEHFQTPHELVPCEVDHPHAAAPQLADDLVVGVVDQLGRKGVDRWGRNDRAAGAFGRRYTELRPISGRLVRLDLGVLQPSQEFVGR